MPIPLPPPLPPSHPTPPGPIPRESFLHKSSSDCHHCHVHSPIPVSQLIRTHPLRSSYINPIQTTNSTTLTEIQSSNGENSLQEQNKKSIQSDRYSKDPPDPPEYYNIPETHQKNHSISHPRCKHHIHRCSKHGGGGGGGGGGGRVKKKETTNGFDRQFTETTNQDKSITITRFQEPTFDNIKRKVSTKSENVSTKSQKVGVGICGCCCDRQFCSKFQMILSTSLLIAGYALLIVIALVVGVVVSQGSSRRERLRTGQIPSRIPVVQGVVPSNRFSRTRATSTSNSQQTLIGRGSPAPVAHIPSRRPISPIQTTTQFPEYEYDYVYVDDPGFDDSSLTLANSVQNQVQSSQLPPFPGFRPIPVNRPIPVSRPARVREPTNQIPSRDSSSSSSPSGRRTLSKAFKQSFDLEDQITEEVPRGQRVPDVQILKSWSNVNGDGTFSYGYVNTDGSYKNETRGLDCVVRGIYGYIDPDTGNELSFPYESGNPCLPDTVDYYVDYETGDVMTDGHKAEITSTKFATNRRFF